MKTVIRQERLNKNWTLEYVGKQIGVSKQMIHDIETTRRMPSYRVLLKLETLFNLSHKELFKPIKKEA